MTNSGDLVISVQNVSKSYWLYDRPQDRLKQALLWRFGRTYGREFWALRDISFDIRRGEALGIIGSNGAGKSTLLQIISGILQPISGKVVTRGRVAALLELGSGFNSDYTGRENIFLNGALLGLSHQEMEASFDDIAAFADIGEFIDQPVKVYSSGMLVRLAFAVQSHVQADVLIVDEALSVGDIHFQHKCMRHIRHLLDRGVTLLFVSHSTETVKRFCQKGLWLDAGQMYYYGEAGVAAEKYLAFIRMKEQSYWSSVNSTQSPIKNSIMPLNTEPLAIVADELDLSDEKLIQHGKWIHETISDKLVTTLSTDDCTGQVGFCFEGSHLELEFWKGPGAGTVRVRIDEVERRFDMFSANVQQSETIRFVVEPGFHDVVVDLVEEFHSGKISLVRGRIIRSQPLKFLQSPQIDAITSEVERYGNGKGRLTAVELLDYETEQPLHEVRFGQRVRLRLHAVLLKSAVPRVEFSYIVRDRNRVDLFGTTTVDEHIHLDPRAEKFVIEFSFDVRLGPGSYSILASFVECSEDLAQRVPMDQIDIACVFNVPFNSDRPVWYLFDEPVYVQASVE